MPRVVLDRDQADFLKVANRRNIYTNKSMPRKSCYKPGSYIVFSHFWVRRCREYGLYDRFRTKSGPLKSNYIDGPNRSF